MTQKEWYSPKEAAEYMGVAVVSVYRWLDSGRLGSYRFGRLHRITPEHIRAFGSLPPETPSAPEPVQAAQIELPEMPAPVVQASPSPPQTEEEKARLVRIMAPYTGPAAMRRMEQKKKGNRRG